ncbi:HipA family kinase [Propionibacteriaceae bacterium Y1685]
MTAPIRPDRLPSVTATTYLLPLREGGSLPGLMEADDLGTYVVKFTGAGQGPRALVAEIVVAEIARAVGIRTPELALIEVSSEIGRREADDEVQQLLLTSAGTNLAVDFLPGAIGFDPALVVPPEDAAAVLWLDAFVANVDRSARNTNLLLWHRDLWAIDHGACLRFHHAWSDVDAFAGSPYRFDDHVLQGLGDPRAVHEELAALVTDDLLAGVLDLVPDAWLAPDPDRPDPRAPGSAATARDAYVSYLSARLDAAGSWLS